jgi:DNA-binding transcriptional regulator YiaG
MTPDEIRALRESIGLSQQGLADRLHEINPLLQANRNTVSRWERGYQAPGPHYLAALRQIADEQTPRLA